MRSVRHVQRASISEFYSLHLRTPSFYPLHHPNAHSKFNSLLGYHHNGSGTERGKTRFTTLANDTPNLDLGYTKVVLTTEVKASPAQMRSAREVMRSFLKIYRISLLLVVNFFFLLIGIMATMAYLDEKKRTVVRARCSMAWSRMLCRVLGIHISVGGAFKRPRGAFIVCNHSSYLDILIIGSVIPSVFVSKHDVRQWPLIGWLASLGSTIFINRESRRDAVSAAEKIRKTLSHTVNVVMFPEATTTDGTYVKAFKSALFKVPAERNIPVIPVSIQYNCIEGRPLEHGEVSPTAWYDDAPLGVHAWKILGIRSIAVALRFNPPLTEVPTTDNKSEARKVLSSAARESVKKGLQRR